MKRIEFKEKYSNSNIIISNLTLNIRDKINYLEEVCVGQLGCLLERVVNTTTSEGIILIYDPKGQYKNCLVSYPIEVFFSDWELVCNKQEQEEYKEIKEALRRLSIETEKIKKIESNLGPEYWTKQGFIQSTTTKTISLWWHIDGRRVAFMYNKGIFELD